MLADPVGTASIQNTKRPAWKAGRVIQSLYSPGDRYPGILRDVGFPRKSGHGQSSVRIKKDMANTHKPYEEEFKRQAVELYLSSGKSLKQVSRELGVSDGSLRKWQKDLFGGSGGQGGVSRERDESLGATDPKEMAQEVRRMNQENAYLRRQRDILKKAASILAEDPQLGMR